MNNAEFSLLAILLAYPGHLLVRQWFWFREQRRWIEESQKRLYENTGIQDFVLESERTKAREQP